LKSLTHNDIRTRLQSYTFINYFFFKNIATTEIYTLSLHDALPIYTNRSTYKRGIKMEQKINQIVKWLQEKVEETGAKGCLVGLSGVLDSAVVTNLIKRACLEGSLAVVMSIQSNPDDMTDAEETVIQSGIDSIEVDLPHLHDVLYQTITNQLKQNVKLKEQQNRIADANLRACTRMSTLSTIATHHQYLVVGTDNAAEWYTGYFTKYGDGAVDIQPIIDLTKQEVKDMAIHLN